MNVRMKQTLILVMAAALWLGIVSTSALAIDRGDAREIDRNVNKSLQLFQSKYGGADRLLHRAKGVLVFGKVIQAGLGFGAQHGQGKLWAHGHDAGYYQITSGSWGLQIGAQKKDIILLFMTEQALRDFRASDGFNIGVDGNVTLIKVGAGKEIDADSIHVPIAAFIVGQKGLMLNVSLQGSKIGRLHFN